MGLSNRKSLFLVACIFLASVSLRFFLSRLVPTPIVFGDELLWSRVAESLHNHLNTDFRGNNFITHNIFYPIIISVAYFFEDSSTVYSIIKFINCVLMSAVAFPIFFLSRRIFDNKWLVLTLVIISVSIPDMFQTALIMQEPLFYLVITVTVYFIYCEFEEPNKFLSIKWNVFMSFLLYLCYFTKAVGLSLLLSYIIYLALSYFLFKHVNLKQLALKYLIVFLSFASYYLLMKFCIEYINGFPNIDDLYSNKLHFQFNMDILLKATTGLLLIIFYTFVAFMILPVIVSIAGISKQNSPINQLNIFILVNTVISIAIIDIMIFVLETSNMFEVRIHVRYLFVYFIFYMITCAYHLYYRNKNIVNLVLIVTSSIFAMLSSYILEKYKLVYPMLYVDAMMLAYFNFYYKYDIFKLLFNISIVGSITILVYWVFRGKFRQTLVFTIVSVFVISLVGNYCMYSLFSNNYKNVGNGFGSNELRTEISSITDYLKKEDKEKNIKVLLIPPTEASFNGGDGFKIDSLESLLNVRYSVLPFAEAIKAPFTNGVFNVENFYPFAYKYSNSPKEKIGKIDYVITTLDNVIFDGLSPVSINGVGKFYKVFKVNSESGTFRVAQMITNRHVDLWNDGVVKVRIYSDKQEINLEVSSNALDNPVDPKLVISDSTGHEAITSVKRTGSLYNFKAYKNPKDQFFEISFKSNDSFVPNKIIPNSTDTRELSFRLLDVKVIN
jgi:hypothetical protein